jgi:ATP-dependent Clp protease protease subunit
MLIVVDKNADGERSYDLYSRMLKDRVVFLNGETNDNTCNSIITQLLYLDSLNNEDIMLYVNSPGGSCSAGLSVVDTMNLIKSDVRTIVTGIAASMGSIIASSGTKGKRYILPHAEFMIHQVLSGTRGQVSDMEIAVKHANKTYDKLLSVLAKNTGQTKAKLKRDCDRDNWMDSKQSVKYGLCDEVLK